MSIVWEKDGEGFYATVMEPAGEIRFRLTVENSGAHWNWTVWRPGKYAGTLHRGHALTLHAAMWDAERSALRQQDFRAADQTSAPKSK